MLRSYRARQLVGFLAWSSAAVGIAAWLVAFTRSSSARPHIGAPAAARHADSADLRSTGPHRSSPRPRASARAARVSPFGRPLRFVLEFHSPVLVRVGDPVHLVDGTARRLCGYVDRIDAPAESTAPLRAIGWTLERPVRPFRYTRTVEIVLYAPRDGTFEAEKAREALVYCAIDDSLLWVVEELMTPDRRAALQAELERAFEEHGAALYADLQPIASELLRDFIAIAEQDAPGVLQRHRDQLQRLGDRYRTTLVQERLVPLVQSEIFPIARKHAEPIVWQVGKEIWMRVRLWSLAWRFVADRVRDQIGQSRSKLLEDELRRFVNNEVVPILQRHMDDFVAVVEKVLVEAAARPRVQEEFARSIEQIAHDRELQQLLVQIGRELYWDNPRARERFRQRLNAPETRRALERMAKRIEDTSQRIGQILFGTLQDGITPEFASVLRRRILQKDRRWLEWRTGPETQQDPAIVTVRPTSVHLRH